MPQLNIVPLTNKTNKQVNHFSLSSIGLTGSSSSSTSSLSTVNSHENCSTAALAPPMMTPDRLVASFRLRGIDVNQVKDDYLAGNYNQFELDVISVKKPIDKITLTRQYSDSADDAAFILKLGTAKHRLVSTNHNIYRRCLDEDQFENVRNNHCVRCFREVENSENAVYLPVKRYRGDIDGCFYYCTFNCAYGHLLEFISKPAMRRPAWTTNAESYLRSLYYEVYPEEVGKPIRPTPPAYLRECFGGPLSDEEYYSNTYQYRPVPHIRFQPAKNLYERVKI